MCGILIAWTYREDSIYTATPKIQSFADLKSEVRKSLDKSATKRVAPAIAASAALAGYELYKRRATWVPEVQQQADGLKAMVPLIIEDIKAKFLGEQSDDGSLSDEEFSKIFAADVKQTRADAGMPTGDTDAMEQLIADILAGRRHE